MSEDDSIDTARTPENGAASPSRSSRPTLKDIAFMTGLGVATVSRALNDAPDIGQATKERVRLVARQIGYRPNRAGVRLRTGKTNVISIVLHHKDEIADSMPQLMFGISEALVGTPYHLIMTPYFMDRDPLEPVQYVVESGSADGIILSRMEPDDARVRYLTERGFPFAAHGRTEMDISHPYHDFDNHTFARMAVERLATMGRKHIALVGPPHELTFVHHTSQGFLEALAEFELEEVPVHVTIDDENDDITREIVRMMQSRHPPDGIVCSAPGAALAVAAGVEQTGATVGNEIDMVVKQASNLKFRPAMQIIQENHREAGSVLARAVMATIDGVPPKQLQSLQVPDEVI